MKVRDVIGVLTKNSFELVRQRGSHRQFKGTVNGQPRVVTVPGSEGDDITKGTLASIRRQSGLPRKLFR